MPPLRERREDIRPLVEHHRRADAARAIAFTEEALRALERYRWPGNVRELQNVVEQAGVDVATAASVDVEQLPRVACGRPATASRRHASAAGRWPTSCTTALVSGGYKFWEHIHPLFLKRDITRHDLRELVRRGLTDDARQLPRRCCSCSACRTSDYKRFLNFLAAHDCGVDFRPFRAGVTPGTRRGIHWPASTACRRRRPRESSLLGEKEHLAVARLHSTAPWARNPRRGVSLR